MRDRRNRLKARFARATAQSGAQSVAQSVALSAAVLGLIGAPAHAQDPLGGALDNAYVGVRIGKSFAHYGNGRVEPTPASALPRTDDDSTLDAASAVIGYSWDAKFGLPVRTELDYTYRSDFVTDTKPTVVGALTDAGSDIHIQTFMFNALYDFELDGPLTPYVGAGLGASRIRTTTVSYLNTTGAPFNYDERAVWDLAYSLNAGAGYDLGGGVVLDLNYRYIDFGTGKGHPGSTGRMGLGDYRANEVMMGARYHFGGPKQDVAMAAPAWAADKRYYAALELGAVQQDKSDLTEHGAGAMSRTDNFWGFERGPFAAAAVGYRVNPALRVEGELSHRRTKVDRAYRRADAPEASGTVKTTALMANALFDINAGLPVVPYVGGGLGVARIKYDQVSHANTTAVLNDADTQWAGQGIVGATYPLSDSMALFVDYRYFRTANPKIAATATTTEVQYKSHALGAGLRFAF